MSKEEIKEKVFEAVKELTKTTLVEESNTFEQLNITSLIFIRLVVLIEKKCQMRFQDDDINLLLFEKVEDVVSYVLNATECSNMSA